MPKRNLRNIKQTIEKSQKDLKFYKSFQEKIINARKEDSSPTLLKNPKKSNDNEEENLHKSNMKLESTIEALLRSSFKSLPNDDDIKMGLAKEKMTFTNRDLNRTIEYYTDHIKTLETDKKQLDERILELENVNDNLSKILQCSEDEDTVKLLNQRNTTIVNLFQLLRPQLNTFLNTRYGDFKMDSLLKKFYNANKVGTHVYVPKDEFGIEEHSYLDELLSLKIIMTNPKNPEEYKLNNPSR